MKENKTRLMDAGVELIEFSAALVEKYGLTMAELEKLLRACLTSANETWKSDEAHQAMGTVASEIEERP